MFNSGKNIIQEVLNVDGMMCVHCQKRVEDAVKSLKGVKSVAVSLENNTVTLSYDGDKLSRGDVVKSIVDAGYTVKD